MESLGLADSKTGHFFSCLAGAVGRIKALVDERFSAFTLPEVASSAQLLSHWQFPIAADLWLASRRRILESGFHFSERVPPSIP